MENLRTGMKYNFEELIPRENTDSIKYDLRKEYFGNEDIIPMWVADMDFATPDFVRNAVIKRAEQKIYGYSIRKDDFHESIISWMSRRHGWEISKEWISFSPGIVPALNFSVLAYSNPGDKILIQPPVYFPFFTAIKDHDRVRTENVLQYTNGSYSIDFEDFEEKAKDAGLFILCHPHNPVGRLWSEEELSRILEICSRHNTLVISDEIHSDLILPGKKHIPLLTLPGAEEICISMYAPSKTFNLAGLSTSFLIIANDDLKKKFDRVVEKMHVGLGNIFGAEALKAAYNEGEEWLGQLMDYLQGNLDFLHDFLSTRIPEIQPIEPEATYMVWLDCTKLGMNDEELKAFMIEKAGLGLNDGPVFGAGGSGFQRINLAAPRAILKKALIQLESAIDEYRQSSKS